MSNTAKKVLSERKAAANAAPAHKGPVTIETFRPLITFCTDTLDLSVNAILNKLYSKEWHSLVRAASDDVRRELSNLSGIPRKVIKLVAWFDTHVKWATEGQEAWRAAKAAAGDRWVPSFKPFTKLYDTLVPKAPLDPVKALGARIEGLIIKLDEGEVTVEQANSLIPIITKLAAALGQRISSMERQVAAGKGKGKPNLAAVPGQ